MAWDITVEFPLWGEDGEFPQDGFFYEGGDQVNEKHLDALWNGTQTLQDETESALEDIDSDRDGVVDEADTTNLYKNNDIDTNGDGVVDEADFAASSEDGVPQNAIIMWSGSISSIPSGWTLCDGTDGAPDLTDRFVTGAGGQYSVGDVGGEDEHTLTESEIPSHDHSYGSDDSETGNVNHGTGFVSGNNDGDQTGIIRSAGGDEPHENRPPYYALAFIMKL